MTNGGRKGRLSRGIPLIAFGAFWILLATVGLSSCLASPSGNCAIPGAFLGIGTLVILVGVLVILTSPFRPPALTYDPAVPPPLIQPLVIKDTVREQVVKARCRYCGSLAEVTATACPTCGAPL
jgi:hypothetical protein